MTGSSLTEDEVRRVFSPLETRGGSAEFLKHVSEDVDWTIKGTHPLACHYFSRKEFQVRHPGLRHASAQSATRCVGVWYVNRKSHKNLFASATASIGPHILP